MNSTLFTILGIAFIFLMTTLGAAIVFFFRKTINSKLNALLIGFASGIMLAASIWSLLLPALELCNDWGAFQFVPAFIGIVLGGVFLTLLDKLIPKTTSTDLAYLSKKRLTKLFIAITTHNIPEGLAVGFGFGAAAAMGTSAAYLTALGLAIGIGIQNFPEGAAVSLPYASLTNNRKKAFLLGMFSGAVEPIFAVLGYFLASTLTIIQPWLLAFAAGAMIFVVSEELIPEAQSSVNPHIGTWGVILGFSLMMILDVCL